MSNDGTEGGGGESDFAGHQGFRRTEHDLTTALCQNSLSLPLIQEAARREDGDVRLVGQLFIPDVKFDSFRNSLPHTVGKISQHLREPLAGGLASRGDVETAIYHEVVVSYQQRILDQPGILKAEESDGGAIPYQRRAIDHGFGTYKIVNRLGQECRPTADFAGRKPVNRNRLSLRRHAIATRAPTDYQKQMVGSVSLARHHGMCRKSTPGCGRNDRGNLGGG